MVCLMSEIGHQNQRTCVRARICVKTDDSMILLGCHVVRKEGSHRTIYEPAKRKGIQTNYNFWLQSDTFVTTAQPRIRETWSKLLLTGLHGSIMYAIIEEKGRFRRAQLLFYF